MKKKGVEIIMTKNIPVIRDFNYISERTQVINDIHKERERQNFKWGIQRHSMPEWYTILGEEFGEVGQAMQLGEYAHKASDANNLYKELIQVAAVASAMAEQVIEYDDSGH